MLFVYQNFGLSTCDFHQHWDIILVIMLSNIFLVPLSLGSLGLCVRTPPASCCVADVTFFSLSVSGSFPSCLHQSPSYWKVSLPSASLCAFSTSNTVAVAARSLI